MTKLTENERKVNMATALKEHFMNSNVMIHCLGRNSSPFSGGGNIQLYVKSSSSAAVVTTVRESSECEPEKKNTTTGS